MFNCEIRPKGIIRSACDRRILWITIVSAMVALTACSSYPGWLASSGPSREQIIEHKTGLPVLLVDISDVIARRVASVQKLSNFSQTLSAHRDLGYVIGAGDTLEVSVWEAPPATLFGTTLLDARAGPSTTRETTLPDQMVSVDGTISVPFAGNVPVAGKSPRQVEVEIERELAGKANQPQVLVRVTRNVSSNVTVIGEVSQSLRMPLTAKGERLLDAIAAAGGVRQPLGKVMVQVSRNGQVYAMPLEAIVQDARQNVLLQPGDVVAALYQPLSFTALGATGRNEEINFEAQGITLAQALGRVGGTQDTRADAQGVFVFRFEDSAVFGRGAEGVPLTPEGKVPVVYRLDLKDPRSFLVAQDFPVRNKDVIYVANAPAAELQKFLNILTSSIYSASSLVNLKP